MTNLKELKTRLEKLPQRKAEGHLAAIFSEYNQKIKNIRIKLQAIYQDMTYAIKVNSNPEYNKKLLPDFKKAVQDAKTLIQDIEEDPNKVKTNASDHKVIRLGEYSNSLRNKCDSIWQLEITSSAKKWENIAEVIQKLGAKGGQEFKQAVEKLKTQKIPQNDADIFQIKEAQNALQKGITGLGLEGPFGEFLKNSAESGAPSKDLTKDEVRSKLDEYNLWDSFSIWLNR